MDIRSVEIFTGDILTIQNKISAIGHSRRLKAVWRVASQYFLHCRQRCPRCPDNATLWAMQSRHGDASLVVFHLAPNMDRALDPLFSGRSRFHSALQETPLIETSNL